MRQVKVWNKNVHPYKEDNFNGENIRIPAGGYIVMEEYEAISFMGRAVPIVKMADGLQDPRSYKMLVREYIDEKEAKIEAEKYNCQACGKAHKDQASLDEHTDDEHLDMLSDQDVATKRRTKKSA